MRFLIVDTYYPQFLNSVYERHPGLSTQPYERQLAVLLDQMFGTGDFYSYNLKAAGHEATEVIANCRPLQQTWAREHHVKTPSMRLPYEMSQRIPRLVQSSLNTILEMQVRDFQPDVIHFQNPVATQSTLLSRIRRHVRLITCQISSRFPSRHDFSPYDLVFSSIPQFVERFRTHGIRSERLNLGFEPRVLERVSFEKKHPLIFVGGLTRDHAERTRFLEQLAVSGPVFSWWGYGQETLELRSPLRSLYQGSAWGIEMYQLLAHSKICLNFNVDWAPSTANNMRLYETTGVGSLLLTDWKENLPELFDPETEVVTYRGVEECIQKVAHLLEKEEERSRIAKAGQERTLCDHTYRRRIEQFLSIVGRIV